MNDPVPDAAGVFESNTSYPRLRFLPFVPRSTGSSLQHVPAHDHSITGVSLEQPGHPNRRAAHQVQCARAHRCGRAHVHQQSGHLDKIPRIPVSLLYHVF